MKAKPTSPLDDKSPPQAEGFARGRAGESLCTISEQEEGSFSQRWRGQLRLADRDDERYRALAKRYL
jgi:hypothetical protein